ncbi:MAG: polysaccharide deacetylase [Lachnospiraceae bacterium]|nr:polysaccharide deacetylase [Lachnospiraceae bacterium]
MRNRKNQVQRLKIVLVEGLLVFLLIPLILSIFLLVKVNRLQEQLEDLQETVLFLNTAQKSEEVKPEDTYTEEEDTHLESEEAYSQSEDTDLESEDTASQPEGDEVEEEIEEPDDSGKRKVYLTFDDGPGPYTNEILDILDEYGVKATFFVTAMHGNRYEECYSRIVEEGHSLGIHSYSHVYNEIYSSLDSFQADFKKMQDYLYELTGEHCRLYRFPGGSSNTVSAIPIEKMIRWLEEEEVVYFDWNVSSQDSVAGRTAQEIAASCIQGVEKYRDKDTIIILLHDAIGKKSTVEALPLIIEGINGLEDTVLSAIDENTVPVQHISITKE